VRAVRMVDVGIDAAKTPPRAAPSNGEGPAAAPSAKWL
jgi:hypothetical protein